MTQRTVVALCGRERSRSELIFVDGRVVAFEPEIQRRSRFAAAAGREEPEFLADILRAVRLLNINPAPRGIGIDGICGTVPCDYSIVNVPDKNPAVVECTVVVHPPGRLQSKSSTSMILPLRAVISKALNPDVSRANVETPVIPW